MQENTRNKHEITLTERIMQVSMQCASTNSILCSQQHVRSMCENNERNIAIINRRHRRHASVNDTVAIVTLASSVDTSETHWKHSTR